jgi:hypothetical protein
MAQVVSVTPNKRTIIAGNGHRDDHPGYIKFWSFDTGEFIRSDKWLHKRIWSLLATPDSQSVIASGHDRHIYGDGKSYVLVGDIETGVYQILQEGDDASVILSFTWDKKYILFGGHIWGWQAGGKPLPKRHTDPFPELGRIILTAEHGLKSTDEGFIIENFQTGKIVQKINTVHDNKFHRQYPIKVTPDGRYILSQKGNFDSNNQILAMWDIHTGNFVKTFDDCKGEIKSIDITADGQYAIVLAYNHPDSRIKVLDIQTGEIRLSINPKNNRSFPTAAQHSVHPISGKERRSHGGGSRRVFGQFSWLGVGSGKMAFSRPTHQYPAESVRGITQAVGHLLRP